MMLPASDLLFRSFFLGGFECSAHGLRSGRRLDLVAATAHDRHARADYARLRGRGIASAREGIRWRLIETVPGRYEFSSVMPIVRAAQEAGVQVLWDLCHYGWPDDVDIFAPAFIERFAGLAEAFARLLAAETDEAPFIAPVNEISFFAWAGAEVGYFYPFAQGRAHELKCQLVRATLAGCDAIWAVDPRARFVHLDPVIHVAHNRARPADRPVAAAAHALQWQAWDMLCGRVAPELGGAPRYLDIIGVNYYPNNQWIYNGPSFEQRVPIHRGHPQYRRLRHLLGDVFRRYGRPLLVAETGSEDAARVPWLRSIGREVRVALRAGVPVEGLCWYPILNHPGWDDDRHVHNGLWDYADAAGDRAPYRPLARELQRQQRLIGRLLARQALIYTGTEATA